MFFKRTEKSIVLLSFDFKLTFTNLDGFIDSKVTFRAFEVLRVAYEKLFRTEDYTSNYGTF